MQQPGTMYYAPEERVLPIEKRIVLELSFNIASCEACLSNSV